MYPRKLNLIERFGNLVAKVLSWTYIAIATTLSIVIYSPIIISGIIFLPLINFVFTFVIELIQTTCELDSEKNYFKKIGRKFIQSIRTAFRRYIEEIRGTVSNFKLN